MYTVMPNYSVVWNQYISVRLINHPNCDEEKVLKFEQVEITQVIPLALVGAEMIIDSSAIYYLISTTRS